MNMLREFFNYFISVMMGRRDSLTAFLEPLTMGERYLRWGMETRDIRDFRSAMDHLHLCHDRDAPMANLLIRKYNCIGDVSSAAVETLLLRHQRVIDNAVRTENNYREELALALKKIAESRDYIRKLREVGSLIKAKAEESRLEDLEANAARVREMLESGEGKTEIFNNYDEISSDAMRFFRELDHASAMVMANPLLGEASSETLSSQLRTKLEFLRERIEKFNPIAMEKGKAEKGKAPAGGQEAKPAQGKAGR